MFGVLFYLFFVLLVSGCYCLDDSLLKKIQDYKEKTLRSCKREARHVFLHHIDPICFLPLVNTIACIPLIEYLSYLQDWDLSMGSFA
jgi:hypothetical protein